MLFFYRLFVGNDPTNKAVKSDACGKFLPVLVCLKGAMAACFFAFQMRPSLIPPALVLSFFDAGTFASLRIRILARAAVLYKRCLAAMCHEKLA